jgi:hypothetical protein
MNEEYNLALELGILDGISQGNKYDWNRTSASRPKSAVDEREKDYFNKSRERGKSVCW